MSTVSLPVSYIFHLYLIMCRCCIKLAPRTCYFNYGKQPTICLTYSPLLFTNFTHTTNLHIQQTDHTTHTHILPHNTGVSKTLRPKTKILCYHIFEHFLSPYQVVTLPFLATQKSCELFVWECFMIS